MPKRAKYVLKVKVEGPGVHSGAITIPDLLRICQATQEAVNRQAEAMRGGRSLRPGPKAGEVYEECTLELTGIRKGSTVLPFRFAKPQQTLPLPDAKAFGTDVISEVVAAVKKLGAAHNGHRFDPGVLDSLRSLGDVFEKNRISRIELIGPARPQKRPVRAVFDKHVRERVMQEIKGPSQKTETVEGVLEMADFKEQEHKCRIHPPIGQPILCTFDEGQEDEIYDSLRKPVQVTGAARINPNNGRIEELHINKIGIVDQLVVGAKDFFTGRSIQQLAEIQDIKPLEKPNALAGGWPPDEDVDAFLEEIYSTR